MLGCWLWLSLSCQKDRDQAAIQADDGADLLVTGAASSWFELLVSAGSAVGNTFRALEEMGTAAGPVSAPGFGDGG